MIISPALIGFPPGSLRGAACADLIHQAIRRPMERWRSIRPRALPAILNQKPPH